VSAGRRILRWLGRGLAAFVALFLIGRGIAEFFIIRYSDPASYRQDWGGPSLAGVFAVHTGPAVIIIVGAAIAARRRRSLRASGLADRPARTPDLSVRSL
jgi:hypothetical protein